MRGLIYLVAFILSRKNHLQKAIIYSRCQLGIFRWMHKTSSRSNQALYSSESTSKDISESPKITRGNHFNFAGKWQEAGNHYISYDNLCVLNNEVSQYVGQITNKQKQKMLLELKLTYFARFHSVIREEYQHQKSIGKHKLELYCFV
jgi:hypothetical protein